MTTMPGTSVTGPLPALTAEQTAVGNQLRTHVEMLANTIGPRHELEREGLEQTADYILEEFRSYGYNPEVSTYGEAGFRNINVTLIFSFNAFYAYGSLCTRWITEGFFQIPLINTANWPDLHGASSH